MKIIVNVYNLYAVLINIIASFATKISDRARVVMMNGSLLLLSGLCLLRYCNHDIREFLHYNDYKISGAVILLLVLLIASVDRKIGLKKSEGFNKAFMTGWLICFVLIITTAFFYYVKSDYLWWGILSVTIFPLIWITWYKRNDFYLLCNYIARIMVLLSYIYLAFNLLMSAFITNSFYAEGLDDSFLGIAANPNGNGLIVIPFFTSALYLLITEKKKGFVYLLSMSISLMLIIISNTRTAELAVILEIFAAIALYLRHCENYTHYKLTKSAVIAIIAAFTISVLAGSILICFDRIDSHVYAESGETEEWTPLVEEMAETTSTVYEDKTLNKLNEVSSGRLLLWIAYSKILKFTGHGNPKGEVFLNYPSSRWAHNNAIDIWYASGFLAFIGYVVWLLTGWSFVFRCLFSKNKYKKEYMLTALAFIGYFTEAMLEITIYPMCTGIVFLMYMTLIPIAFKNERDGTRFTTERASNRSIPLTDDKEKRQKTSHNEDILPPPTKSTGADRNW